MLDLALVRTDVHDNHGDAAHGADPSGGGIWLDDGANIVFDEGQVFANSADRCGGLRLGADSVVDTIRPGGVHGNHADVEGGGVCADLGGSIGQIAIEGNTTPGDGGGIVGADLFLAFTSVRGNVAGQRGGGLAVHGDVWLEEVVLEGNEAGEEAGGLDLALDTSTLMLASCTVAGNTALGTTAQAGGVVVAGGSVTSAGTTWGDGVDANAPADVALTVDGLVCDYTGAQSFVYDDGSGGTICP